eukprot:2274997-Heterocapsa_arctica.AAC.1
MEMTHSGPRSLEEGWKWPAETGSYFMDEDNGAQSAWFGSGGAQHEQNERYHTNADNEWYASGTANDTDTDDDIQGMTQEASDEYLGDFTGVTEAQLRHEYLFAKRRF